MVSAHASTDWRPEIDGLRAVAVLTVVAFHAFPALMPGGFIGVDVFFVISGYLITGILLRELAEAKFSIMKFYERRARRLFPALALVLVATMLAVWLVGDPAAVESTAKHGLAGAFSVANVVYWREAGYFDTASHLKPFLNLWSLGVEEQFYLAWPLVLMLLFRRQRWLVWTLAVICLGSLAGAQMLSERARDAAFYLPIFRVWELGSGAILACLVGRGWAGGRWLSCAGRQILGVAGIVLILSSAMLLDASMPFPGVWAIPPVLGACAVLWAGTGDRQTSGSASSLLTNRVAVYIGTISYSLYLWHWPLLVVPVAAGIDLPAWARAMLVLLALLLASATLRWVEQPLRYSRSPRRAALQASLLLLVAALVCVAVYLVERHASRALRWPAASEGRETCPADLRAIEPALAYCRVARQGPPDAVVWGDSHADHLYPGIAAMDSRRNWMLLGHMSCPPMVGIEVVADEAHCAQRSEAALRWIESQPTIRTVVIGFYGHYADATDVAHAHVHGPVGPSKTSIDGSRDQDAKRKAVARGLAAAVKRLIMAGKRVVLVLDIPELPFASTLCYSRPRWALAVPQCSVQVADVARRQQAMRDAVSAIAQDFPAVVVVDPLGVLCDATRCRAGTDTAALYRDSHHLSKLGSEAVAQEILAAEAVRY